MRRGAIAERALVHLLRELAAGRWSPGTRLPPVRELAREVRVSQTTLIAALRLAAGHGVLEVRERQPVVVLPDGPEQARRVLERLETRPASRCLAVLVPEAGWPVDIHTQRLLYALAGAAADKGVETRPLKWPLANQVAFAHRLSAGDYGAALVMGGGADYLPALDELHRQRFPVVLNIRSMSRLDLPTVSSDSYAASWHVGEIMARHGHRNLCMVAQLAVGTWRGSRDRVDGWLDFLDSSGLIASCTTPAHFVPANRDPAPHIQRLFGYPGGPTAVLFAGAGIAEAVLTDERYASARVPDEVSMATFGPSGDIPVTPWRPRLTSITDNYQRTAQCTLEIVEQLLAGNPSPPSIRIPRVIHQTASIGEAPAAAPAKS